MKKSKNEHQITTPLAVHNFIEALSKSRVGSKETMRNNKSATLKLFSKLTEEYKLICVDQDHNALYIAIAKGYDLDLIEPLILRTDPQLFFAPNVHILETILMGSSTMKFDHQLKILNFILNYLRENKIDYNILSTMEYAISCSDKIAAAFLRNHKEFLEIEGMSQFFLDKACISRFMPECVELLIQSGGVLSSTHTKVFESGFKIQKYIPAEEEFGKFIKFFHQQGIKIPIFPNFFLKTYGVLQKEILVNDLVTDCSSDYWMQLEKILAKVGDYSYFEKINLDLIEDCYTLKPREKISFPENLAMIAFVAIKRRHPLIHVLLKRGLDLNQIVFMKDPALRPTLAHYVAFYSTDKKLLQKLQSITATNALFGRNPAHYAALAMPREFDKENLKKKRKAIKESKKSLLDPRLDDSTSVYLCQDNYYTLYKKYFNFKLIGSSGAFQYANLIHNGLVKDLFGFTPLDYVRTHVDETKRKHMLNAFMNSFLTFLSDLLVNFPIPLIAIITHYLFEDTGDPDRYAISWSKALISKKEDFSENFQQFFINPLRQNFSNNDVNLLYIRNAMCILSIISLKAGSFGQGGESYIFKEEEEVFTRPVESNKMTTQPQLDLKSNNSEEKILRVLPLTSYLQMISQELISLSDLLKAMPALPKPLFNALPSPRLFLSPTSSSSSLRSSSSFFLSSSSSSSLNSSSSMSPFRVNASSGDLFFPYAASAGCPSSSSSSSSSQNKRPHVESIFQPADVSWKEKRDSLIEQLLQCYESGSRVKPDLKKAMEPFIKKLQEAKDEEKFRQAMELFNDTLDISGSPLMESVDKYGFREFIENLLQESDTQGFKF